MNELSTALAIIDKAIELDRQIAQLNPNPRRERLAELAFFRLMGKLDAYELTLDNLVPSARCFALELAADLVETVKIFNNNNQPQQSNNQ